MGGRREKEGKYERCLCCLTTDSSDSVNRNEPVDPSLPSRYCTFETKPRSALVSSKLVASTQTDLVRLVQQHDLPRSLDLRSDELSQRDLEEGASLGSVNEGIGAATTSGEDGQRRKDSVGMKEGERTHRSMTVSCPLANLGSPRAETRAR